MYCTFDVYYALPVNPATEQAITDIASRFGATLEHRRESNWPGVAMSVELSFVCDEESKWDRAQEALREAGYHVEPGSTLGDDDWD